MVNTIKKHKNLYFIWALMVLCVSVSVVTSNVFVLAAVLLFGVAAFVLSVNDLIVLMVALLPFANVFKLSADSTSLFTIAEIFTLIIAIWHVKKIKMSLFISLLVFAVYALAFSYQQMNFLVIVKLLIGFLLVYYACKLLNQKDMVNMAYTLSFGTGLTMLLAENPGYFSQLQKYFVEINHYVDASGHAADIVRNGGFIGEPNCSAVAVMLSLCFLCLLYYYKQIGTEFWVLTVFLGIIGFFTYSKSYFLSFAAFCIFLLLFVLFPKHRGWAVVAIIAICVFVALAFSGKIEIFNMIFDRFSDDGDITTGRAELNEQYLRYIFSHPKTLLFGDSIASDRYEGAANNVHNFYIELLYKLGIFGAALYVVTWLLACGNKQSALRTKKRHFVHFMPLVFFLILYFFLAGTTRYELPVYMILIYCALNYVPEKTQENSELCAKEATND